MRMIHRSPHPPVEIPDVALADFVLADAAARGERPALVDAASGRTLTYAGLDALARGVASAGGTNTTINGLYTEAEIAHQLKSSRARFLFTISALLDRALPAAAAA